MQIIFSGLFCTPFLNLHDCELVRTRAYLTMYVGIQTPPPGHPNNRDGISRYPVSQLWMGPSWPNGWASNSKQLFLGQLVYHMGCIYHMRWNCSIHPTWNLKSQPTQQFQSIWNMPVALARSLWRTRAMPLAEHGPRSTWERECSVEFWTNHTNQSWVLKGRQQNQA